jgi:NMD protein affecting ribosome stability and mRNA decay
LVAAAPLTGHRCEDCGKLYRHLNDGLCGGCDAERMDGLLMDREMGDS